MSSTIEWEALSHPQLTEALAAGLAESRRRVAEMLELTGMAPAPVEKRGPGRPPNAGKQLSAREQQIADAAESAGVQ